MTDHAPAGIEEWLNDEWIRHNRWRRYWSFLYFFTAIMTIVAGAATTAVAGLGDGLGWKPESVLAWSTLLAAVTTILASAEKVLRLREKWDLHRDLQMDLELISLRRGQADYDDKKALRDIENAARKYSSQLSNLTSTVNDNGNSGGGTPTGGGNSP